MKKNTSLLTLVIVAFILGSMGGFAQYSTKKVKTKHEEYTDSIKNVEYNYKFPIWGQKVYEKGFDIPYPAGLMANFMWIDQGIDITNMQLGLKTDNNDIPLTPVDFIDFGDNLNTSYTVNIRPDLWVFPFLNVYGIFGYGNSKTEVNLVRPIDLQSVVEQNIATAGFGVMGAGGIGPVWFSVDANFTWNKPELLDEATRVNVVGIRIGKTFTFKNRPQSNIAIWAGGMSVNMQSETRGQIQLRDAIPGLEDRADQIVADYGVWRDENYDDLTLAQKATVNNVLDPIVDRIGAADGSSIIRYGMDKQVSQKWNGIIGAQYQYNKRWMLRSELGVIGDRKSVLISLNYRFLM